MHSYCESLVFPKSAKSDWRNGTSDRKPDSSEQDRSQLNDEKEGKETSMTATSKESASDREILLVGPYGVLGTGVIDAVTANPAWRVTTAARRPAPTYRTQTPPRHISVDLMDREGTIKEVSESHRVAKRLSHRQFQRRSKRAQRTHQDAARRNIRRDAAIGRVLLESSCEDGRVAAKN